MNHKVTHAVMLHHESAEWPVPPAVSKAVLTTGTTPAPLPSPNPSSTSRSWFQASTNVLPFVGFEVGPDYQFTVEVINMMSERNHMPALPPTTLNSKVLP